MARTFSREITPMGYLGTLYSFPTQLCPPQYNPREVRADIDWTDYGATTANDAIGVEINLDNGVVAALNQINSVKIDNIGGKTTIYVYFEDTQWTVVCPPNATLIEPVATAQQKAIIYTEGLVSGQINTTRVHFMNTTREGLLVKEEQVIVPQLVYRGVRPDQLGPAAAFNFLAAPIGAATADRIVVVMVTGLDAAAGGSPELIGCTIGGVTANIAASIWSGTVVEAVAAALVPSGTTADIALTFDENMQLCRVFVYTITNLDDLSGVPENLDYAFATPAAGFRLPIDMPSGSVAISAVSETVPPADAIVYWGNSKSDAVVLANGLMSSVAHINAYSAGQRIFVTGGNLLISTIWD